jgi:hypothetical protein
MKMRELNLTESFASYDAKLVNAMWAFSAIASDGSLVLSCWQHKFKAPEKGLLRYTDQISRWKTNSPGKKLFIEHLSKAYDEQLPVRLVIVSTKDTAIVDAGEDASKLKKTFDVKKDIVGKVISFNGDDYMIDFRKQEKSK